MRVTLCVDALGPQMGGIGRYTWELCRRLGDVSEISQLRFFAHGTLIDEPRRLLSSDYRRRRVSWPFRRLHARGVRRALQSSVVHAPNYFLPRSVEGGVITAHDLSVFLFPDTHPAERVKAFERDFANTLARTAQIITDTETVRGELIEAFSIPEDRITAVPLGVESRFHPRDPISLAPTLTQWDLTSGHYGLCVSTLEPRKKIVELLSAWREIPRPLRDRFPVVLAGGFGWRNAEIVAAVEQAASEGWLRHLGFVDEHRLPDLYAGAALFVYPSIYEGFGLPPLEAMASGVPVITSDRSCLPEVCGNAARYVDPDDPDGFASAIAECLSDREWRSSAIANGIDRAKGYSWDRCIDDTVAIYRRVRLS